MGSEKYILLVEDDLDISEAIKSILEEEKFDVVCKFNGKEALEYLTSTENIPALILLDVMMPFMNGDEFRKAQLLDPKIADIPTVIMSATDKYDDLMKLNFKECLKKPLDLDTLIDVVKKLMNEK
jgi:CheY-like chemotaxis protein